MASQKPTVQLNLRIPLELRERLEEARTPPKDDTGWRGPRRKLSEVVIGILETATAPAPAPAPAPSKRRSSKRPAARSKRRARR